MSRVFAAIDVRGAFLQGENEVGQLLAALDDCRPTAVEDLPDGVRVFFSSSSDRDSALSLLQGAASLEARAVDLPDEGWAERTQAAVRAIRVGHIIVAPPWDVPVNGCDPSSRQPLRSPHVIVVQPSMGFGTGHHATTRLCLRLMQAESIAGASMLDVGTGSGVLALAAWRLGATRVVGIDLDPDAVSSARENLTLNGAAGSVSLQLRDLGGDVSDLLAAFDLVTANVTAAVIERYATTLARCLRAGGRLLVSGFRTDEETDVKTALHAKGLAQRKRCAEDGWVGVSYEPRTRD